MNKTDHKKAVVSGNLVIMLCTKLSFEPTCRECMQNYPTEHVGGCRIQGNRHLVKKFSDGLSCSGCREKALPSKTEVGELFGFSRFALLLVFVL